MFSWFPILFPLTRPLPLAKGQDLVVRLRRACQDDRVRRMDGRGDDEGQLS